MLPPRGDESETERSGAWSTRREIHATGLGAGVGLAVGLTGNTQLAAVFVGATLGVRALKNPKVLKEIRSEPWYALGAFAVGVLVGFVVR